MAKAHNISAVEKKLRIHKVFEMLIEGKSTTTVSKFCMEEWGVIQRTSYRYMQDADKMIAETLKSKKVSKVNRAVAQRELLIEKLIDSNQLAMAAQVMGDVGKLQGLYAQDDVADVNITLKIK